MGYGYQLAMLCTAMMRAADKENEFTASKEDGQQTIYLVMTVLIAYDNRTPTYGRVFQIGLTMSNTHLIEEDGIEEGHAVPQHLPGVVVYRRCAIRLSTQHQQPNP